MAISLVKGGNVNLSKTAPTLAHVTLGLGWKTASAEPQFDLDVSAFLLNAEGKISNDTDFIFFNNRTSANGAVVLSEDNRTGAGEGDDESLTIDLHAVPADVHDIMVAVTIHEAVERRQNFGQVSDAYIRVMDADANVELARFDLDEDASSDTAVCFGNLYRNEGDWKFKALGVGSANTLTQLAATYGAK